MTNIVSVIEEFLSAAGASYVSVEEHTIAGQTIYNIKTENHALIGTYGDTIHALDTLVKKIVEKMSGTVEDEERVQFLVDVNGHRAKHIDDLKAKAIIMAERARSFQYDVELTPMNAYERLIVHTVLQDAPNVKTESRGEGRGRRVVIRYVV